MKPLDTYQIEGILRANKRTAPYFLGVFAADCLPYTIEHYPCCLIMNTDIAREPGDHWVSIYIDLFGQGEYFDSFGGYPQLEFERFLKKQCQAWTWNNQLVQEITSAACGYYCLMHLLVRAIQGMNMQQFVNLFDRNLFNNDRKVLKYIKSHTVL